MDSSRIVKERMVLESEKVPKARYLYFSTLKLAKDEGERFWKTG